MGGGEKKATVPLAVGGRNGHPSMFQGQKPELESDLKPNGPPLMSPSKTIKPIAKYANIHKCNHIQTECFLYFFSFHASIY